MKTISILQPWASLIAIGSKKIEFRSWTTSYRGKLVIHAIKRRHPYLNLIARNSIVREELSKGELVLEDLPMGAIVGMVDLVEIKPVQINNYYSDWVKSLSKEELAFSELNCSSGWFLENAKKIDPIACPGKQGLWETTVVSYLFNGG